MHVNRAQYRKETFFYVKTLNSEKSQRGGRVLLLFSDDRNYRNLGTTNVSKCQNIRVSKGHLKSVEVLPLIRGGGLLILDWVVGMEEDGCERSLHDCTFCTL